MKQIWNQAQTKYSLKFRLTPPAQSRRYTRCNWNRMRISQLNMKLQLQKCLIACKKGIDVVVRFQYSEIRLKSDLKTQSSSGSWIELVLLTPYQQFDKKWKKVQNFSIKWLKTTNLQLSQKSFKTCLRKLIILATFIPRNNLLFYF